MTDISYSKFAHSMVTLGIIFLVLFGLTLTVAPASASTVISDECSFTKPIFSGHSITLSEVRSSASGYSWSMQSISSFTSTSSLKVQVWLNGERIGTETLSSSSSMIHTSSRIGYNANSNTLHFGSAINYPSLSLLLPNVLIYTYTDSDYSGFPNVVETHNVFISTSVGSYGSSPFDLTTTVTQSDSTGEYSISAAKSDSTSPYYYTVLSQKISSIDSSLTYDQEVELQSTSAVTAASTTIASSLPADYNENGDIGYYKYTLLLGTDTETATKTYTWGSRFGSAEPILEFGSTNIIYGSSTSVEAWYASSSGPVAFVVSEGSSLDQSNMVVLEGSLTDSSVKLISDRFTLTPDRVGYWTFAIIANGKVIKSVTVNCQSREITSGDFSFDYNYIESSETYTVELVKGGNPLYLRLVGKAFGWMTVYTYATTANYVDIDDILTNVPAYWSGFGIDYEANVFPAGGGVTGDSWIWTWGIQDFVTEDGTILDPDKTGMQEDPVDVESITPVPDDIVDSGYEVPQINDIDGDGIPNDEDDDIDGDGIPNDEDDTLYGSIFESISGSSPSISFPSYESLGEMLENFRLPSSLKDYFNLVSLEEYKVSLSVDSGHTFYGYQQGFFSFSDNTVGFLFAVVTIVVSVVAVIPELLYELYADLISWLSSALYTFYDWIAIPSEILHLVIGLLPEGLLNLALVLFAVDLIFLFFRMVVPGLTSSSHAIGDIVEKDEKMRLIEEFGEETYNKLYGNKRGGK